MIDVEVRNFQSIEHASVRIDGFTALVGRSNIGKSALVRAIKAALTGAGGTSFVRHGVTCARRTKKAKTCECFCVVHLRAQGFDLKWEKGDKINRYTFNGEVNDRTGQGTPEFLLRPLLAQDFEAVSIARESKLLQVSDQFDNVFLLDQTGGVVADVLSDVARLDRINVAMRLVEKDRKDAASTRKIREKDILDFDARAESYKGLDSVVNDVARVERQLEQISEKQQGVELLSGFLAEVRDLGFKIDELKQVCDVEVPDQAPLVAQHGSYTTLARLQAQASEKATVIRALAGVENVAEPVIQPLIEQAGKVAQLSAWAEKLQRFEVLAAHTKPIEAAVVPEPAPLAGTRDRYLTLEAFITKVRELKVSLGTLEDAHTKAAAEEKTLHDELDALGVCPTCANPVTTPHRHRSVA